MKDDDSKRYWTELLAKHPNWMGQNDLARLLPHLRKRGRPNRPAWVEERARQLEAT